MVKAPHMIHFPVEAQTFDEIEVGREIVLLIIRGIEIEVATGTCPQMHPSGCQINPSVVDQDHRGRHPQSLAMLRDRQGRKYRKQPSLAPEVPPKRQLLDRHEELLDRHDSYTGMTSIAFDSPFFPVDPQVRPSLMQSLVVNTEQSQFQHAFRTAYAMSLLSNYYRRKHLLITAKYLTPSPANARLRFLSLARTPVVLPAL
ncbi:hypothetical protein EDB81DRAFT_234187 [Dactylonectria macrodidyma]|uniref:Uncharacterized protein n=1 Tax=Dactylonectria macrodidyma TaxID=307937 RepID=A0A9P9DH77_9HYPO|nr:hypothetical protein EDB81DRAFT_234187 [Dactylonectria macrodidyma]